MRKITVVFCLILSFQFVSAQEKDLDKIYNKARSKYATGHFEESRDNYVKLISLKPNDFVFNFELGMLLFYELNSKVESIPYFESALKVMKDTVADVYNYLGQAYQSNLQYDKAIEAYNKYTSIPPKEGVIRVSVKRYIDQCIKEKEKLEQIKAAREKTQKEGLLVVNSGPIVNSENDDVSPLLFEGKLVYSSARKFDYVFNEYMKHSYITEYSNDQYKKPESLLELPYKKGMVVDPNWHQEISSVTSDFSALCVIYEEDIWMISKKGKNWGEPVQLNRKINRSRSNAYAALSNKGDRMIFVLFDKKLKQYDLYQTSKNAEGKWKDPIKLNNQINTPKNENYPYLSEDGYTLYFSSDRDGGNGKYDIYKCTLMENNEWSVPELLPSPINSDGNDITFKYYKSINKAYFSSDRKGGFGKYDVYEVDY
jgi:tetratricopeptide (TPR) repeat protein